MPANVAVPIARRLPAPAPVAHTSGQMPSTNVRAVISTARKRVFAPARAASAMPSPSRSRASFANSTTRIAFFEARPTRSTMPSWA